ncbi:hypothetical protein [Glycomyces harbinensis]|uniref:Uncharacterized protein n=1 Tax=Glycomyces harbinensis TaxID=58114 RepID=A0A1G7BK23_9ACTN|nr:hypothetical protein [Glycomyces harbinensis]SDE27438.1 hypothetical protein SAMN05216270_1179 [Glycomyces harbinensis]
MSELTPRLSDALESLRGDRPVSRVQREAQREVDREFAAARVEVARVSRRASVAHIALASTAALSNEEALYLQMAPLGDARYKAIVDAFAIAVANEVGRP